MNNKFTKAELDTYITITEEVAKTPFFGSITPRFEAIKRKLESEVPDGQDDWAFFGRGLADAIKNYVESITRASRYYGACDADRERFQCHNAVVAKIPPLNRLAVRYGLEPLFVPADEGQFERLLEKLNQGLPQGKTLASVLPPDLWKLREEIRIFAEVFYFEVVMNASDDQALNRLWNAKTMEYMRSLEA